MNKDTTRLQQDIGELIGYYSELDDVGHERFLNLFHDQLDDIIAYHDKQIDKLRGLKDRLAGNSTVSLADFSITPPFISDTINTSTDYLSVGDAYPHSNYYWDFDRNK